MTLWETVKWLIIGTVCFYSGVLYGVWIATKKYRDKNSQK